MALHKLLIVLSIVAWVSAGPMAMHESRATPPLGFVRQGVPPDGAMLTLRVALASNNVSGLEEKLMSISTPGSSEFRQWLSMDEVKSFVQPSPTKISAFNAFASANGLKPTVISPNGDWVSITLPVSQANKLFAARFEVFAHPAMTHAITRTLSVSLPSELVGHVDVLHPTTQFVGSRSSPRPARSNVDLTNGPPASCNTTVQGTGVVTPTCLQELYGIPTTPATQRNNVLLVTGYGSFGSPQTADLADFLNLLRPDMPPNTTFNFLSLNNGTDAQGPHEAGGGEANLDIQYTVGIATGVPVQFLAVGGGETEADVASAFVDTTTFLDGVRNPPSVMTTSYGFNEPDVGSSLAIKVCNGYMALGTRGISVIFSSGDNGVHGNDDSTLCNVTEFVPVFPASCPFVTSVGSTQGLGPETAIDFTGGGFSDIFLAPAYQRAAIAGFLETIPANFAGIFNKAGRGFPDVATQGIEIEIVYEGRTELTGGTSASSPIFASIIALINDRLLAARKPALGFLNPFLYSKASRAFTDITSGLNAGDGCPPSSVGFSAAVGWDPLTGFGSPIFSKLLAAAMEKFE
ncbi:family S53 protease-like protein [Mycena epipterygia]|nr:family S53 protease-like protein [Mycena epipterygia]